MHIAGIEKNTLLDYPGMVAATVFTGGCNLRCLFCQNKELVCSPPQIDEEEVMAFLKKRQGYIKGVCISGGEPLMQTDLTGFMGRIRDLGYKVKLDTNGTMSDALEDIIKRGLADYIAMDIKNSPQKYALTAGLPALDLSPVRQSVRLLLDSAIPYEFRTTVVDELHEASDFEAIGQWIAGAKAYYLQAFTDRDSVPFEGFHAPTKENLEKYASIARLYVPYTAIRGV